MDIFIFISHILLVMSLGLYIITNLQWYNYKIERVVLKHHKVQWHIFYFVVPSFSYIFFASSGYSELFYIFFYVAFLPSLFYWHRKLDKKLVVTDRVKRFFLMLLVLTLFGNISCLISEACATNPLFFPILLTILGSHFNEKIIFDGFKKEAQDRLENEKELKIVAITASYGKTSIKNFLYQVLKSKYSVYKTPRSVNTLGGIVKDINNDLPKNSDIYIVEAGARERGDILEIATFLNPQYAIVGQIGAQHIEYFKSVDNITQTKLELLQSKKLQKAFLYQDIKVYGDKLTPYPVDLEVVSSTLDGIKFKFRINDKFEEFEAPILGSFNANNLAVCILMALELGVDIYSIKKSIKSLEPVEHRLQVINSGTKFIIDDSFNGNYEGMSEAIELASQYSGRKVIVTPGLVESSEELNTKIAKKIDEIFDLAIITGDLNAKILSSNINRPQKIVLKEKKQLEYFLQTHTKDEDLILFANDAPNFI
jgi:UDP-N-acetylmuramoyl-tripeptide--D-alanyl-D-alanine ligase